MKRVITPPLGERRERQYAGDESDSVVDSARAKERSMRAVVHEHERSDEQAGDDEVEAKRKGQGPRVQRVDSPHRGRERDERRDQLKRRAPRARANVRPDHVAPIRARMGRLELGQRPNFVTFSAAGPFCPWTTSNSTRSPSASVLKPPP